MARGELGKGDRVGGKYVIEETIGQGGMSFVYRARNEITRKVIALKVLDFGAARVQQGDQHTATHLGTPLYAAP